jgi:hypothetical protein
MALYSRWQFSGSFDISLTCRVRICLHVSYQSRDIRARIPTTTVNLIAKGTFRILCYLLLAFNDDRQDATP